MKYCIGCLDKLIAFQDNHDQWKQHFCSYECLEIYEAMNGRLEFCSFCGNITESNLYKVCDLCKKLKRTLHNPDGDIDEYLSDTKCRIDLIVQGEGEK